MGRRRRGAGSGARHRVGGRAQRRSPAFARPHRARDGRFGRADRATCSVRSSERSPTRTLGVCGPFGIVTTDLRAVRRGARPRAVRRDRGLPDGVPSRDARRGRVSSTRSSSGTGPPTSSGRSASRTRATGARCVGSLSTKHEHRMWFATPPRERATWSKRNFYRFLDRWRDRWDLVLSGEPERHERTTTTANARDRERFAGAERQSAGSGRCRRDDGRPRRSGMHGGRRLRRDRRGRGGTLVLLAPRGIRVRAPASCRSRRPRGHRRRSSRPRAGGRGARRGADAAPSGSAGPCRAPRPAADATSWSISSAVSPEILGRCQNDVGSSRPSESGPIFSLIPYSATIARAISRRLLQVVLRTGGDLAEVRAPRRRDPPSRRPSCP